MSSRAARGLVAAAIALTILATGSAAGGQEKRIAASNAWVKLPAADETQTMAFASFRNSTAYDVFLTSAASDVAGRVELRDASRGGGQAVKPVEFITVPAEERVDLTAAGVHLLLADLKRPLKEGETITLILKTENGSTLDVPAVVKKE